MKMSGSIYLPNKIPAYLLENNGDNLTSAKGEKLMVQKESISIQGELSAPTQINGNITINR